MDDVSRLKKKAKRLVRVNKFVTFATVLWCLYLIAFPFIPNILFAFEQHDTAGAIPGFVQDSIKDGGDRLIIPEIGVNQKIVESSSIKGVGDDVWRRPVGSTPDDGSNTVLVAHRYRSIGGERSSTFYHLPKLMDGDRVFVYWDGVLYEYKVYDTEVVLPSEVSVEAPTRDSELTMYTCTPLYTSTHRHVVHSKLVRETKI